MHSWSVLNIYHKVFISTTDSEEKKIQRNLDAIFSYTDSSNFSNNLYEDVKMIICSIENTDGSCTGWLFPNKQLYTAIRF